MLNRIIKYFTATDLFIWTSSVMLIILSFCIFDRENYLTLVASLVGVTSLIFLAKGHPIGQVLMIVFSLLYGMISLTFRYYGEMLTYIGMTLPMSAFALVSWLKNPYNGKKSEVRVNKLSIYEHIFMWVLAIIVTTIFYYILRYFNTANIVPSTLSVTTSFVAVYLTFRRSPYYAMGYAFNDIILIILWILASIENIMYISVVMCFVAFFVNDIYGFINWHKMLKRQSLGE